MSRKICILCAEDFQDLEVLYPRYRLLEEGYQVTIAGMGEPEYKGKYGYPVKCDADLRELKADDFDCFIVPGGWAPDFLRRTEHAANLIADANRKGKLIAAICHGGWVLSSAKMLENRQMTSFYAIKDDLIHAGARWVDLPVVVDNNLVTSRNPDDLPDFMKAILKCLGG